MEKTIIPIVGSAVTMAFHRLPPKGQGIALAVTGLAILAVGVYVISKNR